MESIQRGVRYIVCDYRENDNSMLPKDGMPKVVLRISHNR